MKSYKKFSKNAERAQQLRKKQQDHLDKYESDVNRRVMNAKRAKLRDKIQKKGIVDHDRLLDDEN